MILKCDECGCETKYVMYIYKKRYCYSCYYEVKRQQATEYQACISPLTRRVKNAYRRGMKPSEISKYLKITPEEVYKHLNEAVGKGNDENSR